MDTQVYLATAVRPQGEEKEGICLTDCPVYAIKKVGNDATRIEPMNNANAIADGAISAAVKAARQYMDTHGLIVDNEALVDALRAEVKQALPGALADAREAVVAGMDGCAGVTFMASMALAGIQAVKSLVA